MEWDGNGNVKRLNLSTCPGSLLIKCVPVTRMCVSSLKAHACHHTLYTSPFHPPSSPFPKIRSCLLGRYPIPVPT